MFPGRYIQVIHLLESPNPDPLDVDPRSCACTTPRPSLAHPSPTLQPTLIALHTHLAPQLQYEHATTGLRCQGPPRSRRARPTRGHYAARFGSTKGPTISILPLRSLRLSHGVIYDQASLEANGVPYTMSYSGRQALFCRDNYGNGWEVPPILAPYLCV